MGFKSFTRAVTKPFKKAAKAVTKIIPKEVKPFIPYAAAAFGAPYLSQASFMSGIGNAALRNAISKGLISGATAAATDDDANILRTAVLAAAPDAIQGGLGAAGQKLSGMINPVDEFAPTISQEIGGLLTKAADSDLLNLAANPTDRSGLKGIIDVGKVVGTQAGIDQAAKLAEINQQEIEDYNANLLSQGLKDKGARRNAIYNIYINAGYQPDYVNGVLDRYGYAKGGEVSGVMKATAARMSLKDFAREIREKQKKKKEKKASGGRIGFNKGGRAEIITGLLNIKDADGNLIYSYEDAVDKANELLPDEVNTTDLQSAVGGLETAFGRPFGNIEPVPMLRFARGGEVIEETEDLGIMDFMKDQGIEYGEQASYGYDDAMGESFEMFQDYRKRGLIPMDMEFNEFLELLQGRKEQGIKGTQVASGYKTDIEDMYEQYVFEMEEMGLQPMSFSEFLAQARSGMAKGGQINPAPRDQMQEIEGQMAGPQWYQDRLEHLMQMGYSYEQAGDIAYDSDAYYNAIGSDPFKEGGKVKRRKKGQEDDGDGKKKGPQAFPKFDEDRLFENTMPEVMPNKPDMMDAAMGGIAHHARRMEAGGLMNRNLLNTGMDKDMRGGGFIPEGTKEKADDVPARLSKNEFVMTADAVRAAGGGSVNEGAKRMYDTMYQLEAKV